MNRPCLVLLLLGLLAGAGCAAQAVHHRRALPGVMRKDTGKTSSCPTPDTPSVDAEQPPALPMTRQPERESLPQAEPELDETPDILDAPTTDEPESLHETVAPIVPSVEAKDGQNSVDDRDLGAGADEEKLAPAK